MKQSTFLLFLFLMACGGPRMPKDQYDEVYKTDGDGYPEYLLLKKTSDSTYTYLFFPEDFKMICEAQLKGVALNQFFKRGPDIEVQQDGSGVSTYRYTGDNYKCSLVIKTGYAGRVKVHSHCNGGNNCPEDVEYVLQK
ncbi:MAG TPA: hypothetical protein VK766_10595 [Cytophagaceae bacterium]|jgi:hypothetical protein|nr:hypothetical protein [Cytophagaceae bacterium]